MTDSNATANASRFQQSRPGKEPGPILQDAALRGASFAFSAKHPVQPKPVINNYSGVNGAFVAANNANNAGARRLRPPELGTTRIKQRVDSEYKGRNGAVSGQVFVKQQLSQPNDRLQPPRPQPPRSASLIAANIAARSAPSSPSHTGPQRFLGVEASRYADRRPTSASSSRDRQDFLDTQPIPPTTSLIGLFEQKATPSKLRGAPVLQRSTDKAVPSRPSSLLSHAFNQPGPAPQIPESSICLNSLSYTPGEPQVSKKLILTPQRRVNPEPLSETNVLNIESEGVSSDDSFVSASSHKPSLRAATLGQKRRLSMNSTKLDSMANAIVASSLASSRAASPSKTPLYPPVPPKRRLFHSGKDTSRTPSPTKSSLKTTLRQPKLDNDNEGGGERKRGRKHIMKKHPHKHHEGDRKRWRDEITARERKRYEAVWASNKGSFGLTFPDSPGSSPVDIPGSDASVCNLVVRDIFLRSRLNNDILEEVYALVDRSLVGRLGREEFVVGLWLIDQRLKGRKLPIRVSESVWRSVGVMGDIKVRKAGW